MKLDIFNRFTGAVQFTAEIDCAEDAPALIKIGLAVRWAVKNNADLSWTKLSWTNLSWTKLSGANLSGADLSWAILRGTDLRGTNLSWADLSGANLSGADLTGTDLSGAILRGAILSGTDLSGTNLRGTDLRETDLSGADLSGAKLSPDVPIIPELDAKILALVEADNAALDMSDWHTCKTTHCRAGWAITLAGEAGRKLEDRFGPAAAGTLIYAASCPDLPTPNLYASDADAIADMRARVERMGRES